MADGKTIKIKFELDQQSFQQVKTAIDSLGSSLQKMNANMPGVNFGGAAPSKEKTIQDGSKKPGVSGSSTNATMGKVILDNAAAFKKFAQEGKDASKIMTEALRRDITAQERSLDGLKDKLHNLNDEFKLATTRQKEFLDAGNKSGASAMGQHIENLEKQLAEASGQTLKGSKDLAGSKDALQAVGGGEGGIFSKIKGQFGSGMSQMMSGGGMGGFASLASTLAPFMLLAKVAQVGFNEVRNGGGGIFGDVNDAGQGGMEVRALAKRGSLMNSRTQALRNGDISDLIVEKMANSDTAYSNYLAQSTDAISSIRAGVWEGGKETIKNLLGAGDDEAAIFESLSPQAKEARLMEAREARKAKFGQMAETQEQIQSFQYFKGTFNNRVSAAQLGGYSTDGTLGKDGKIHGKYRELAEWSAENQIGEGNVLSAGAALRQAGGSSISGYGKTVALAQAGGYSGMDALLAHAARGGNSNLAFNALGGNIAGGAGIQLGQEIFGYDPRGTTSGSGLLAAIQAGNNFDGTANDFNKVQSIGQAIKLGDSVFGGSLDNAMKGSGLLSAKRVLGEGSSSYAQDYLNTGMSFKQMQDIGFGKDKETAQMRTFEISKEQVKKQFQNQTRNFFGGVAGDTGKMGDAVRKFLDSGQSFAEFAKKNPSLKDALDTAIDARSNSGIEGASMFGDVLRGTGQGNALKSGGLGPGKLKGAEADEAKRQKDEVARQETEIDKNKKTFSELLNASQSIANSYSNWAKDMNKTVTDVIEALQRIPGFINRSDKPGTGKVTAPTPFVPSSPGAAPAGWGNSGKMK